MRKQNIYIYIYICMYVLWGGGEGRGGRVRFWLARGKGPLPPTTPWNHLWVYGKNLKKKMVYIFISPFSSPCFSIET